MPKFSVDFDNVINTMSKKSYKLSDVKDKIEKVAFDVFRFAGGNPEELWQIQNADDGTDYIVAMYDEEEKVATASTPGWSVAIKNEDLHFFYKQDHICKMASVDVGFASTDLALAKQYLPAKLSQNKNLVQSLLKTIDGNTLKSILSKYPELA